MEPAGSQQAVREAPLGRKELLLRNSEIYRRTLRFSVMRLVLTVVGILIVVLLPLAAFAATAGASEVACVAATAGAFVAGLVAFFFVARYGGICSRRRRWR